MAPSKKPPLVWALPLGAPADGEGLQQWLYNALRQAILSGRLPGGSLLPGTRTLAAQYKLARGTVQAAYDQLQSEGYLAASQGSGTRVAVLIPDAALQVSPLQVSPLQVSPLQVSPQQVSPRLVASGILAPRGQVARLSPGRRATLAFELRQAQKPTAEKFAPASRPEPEGPWIQLLKDHEPAFPLGDSDHPPKPFAAHVCDADSFPIALWRRLHTRQLSPSRRGALWQSSASGLPALRSAIANHLAIARGVCVAPEQIVVVGSVQQALDLTARLLVAPGDSVWMEDPGYEGARQIMLAAGARIVDVPVDAEGMRVGDAVRRAADAKLAYVTPSRQSPLGVALSPERRLALLQWASDRRAYVFEDDYDSEYRFVAKPLPALKSLPGADDCVILAGTFSKLLFPALRLAYVALPMHLVASFTRAASLTARHTNGLSQAVLAEFMNEGHFDRHIRRMRKIYATRAEAFAQAAARHWEGLIEVPTVHAGLDVVGRLIRGDEAGTVRRLAEAGVRVFPLSKYTSTNRLPPALVMGFAPFSVERIDAAAITVARALGRRP